MYEPSAHFCIKRKLLSDFNQMSGYAYLIYCEECNLQAKGNDLYLKRQLVGYQKIWDIGD